MIAEVLTEATDVIIAICSQYSEATKLSVEPRWLSWIERQSRDRETIGSNPGRDISFCFPGCQGFGVRIRVRVPFVISFGIGLLVFPRVRVRVLGQGVWVSFIASSADQPIVVVCRCLGRIAAAYIIGINEKKNKIHNAVEILKSFLEFGCPLEPDILPH